MTRIFLAIIVLFTFLNANLIAQPSPFPEPISDKLVLEDKKLDSLYGFVIYQEIGYTVMIIENDTSYIKSGYNHDVFMGRDKYLSVELIVFGTALISYIQLENYSLSVEEIKLCDFIYPDEPPVEFYREIQIFYNEITDHVINNILTEKDVRGFDYEVQGVSGFCDKK